MNWSPTAVLGRWRSADVVRAGFRLFGRREQLAFVHSTLAHMRRLTVAALRDGSVREQAAQLTARRGFVTAPARAAPRDRLG